jgi:hypothetical protein
LDPGVATWTDNMRRATEAAVDFLGYPADAEGMGSAARR